MNGKFIKRKAFEYQKYIYKKYTNENSVIHNEKKLVCKSDA